MEQWWLEFYLSNSNFQGVPLEDILIEQHVNSFARSSANWIGSNLEDINFENFVSLISDANKKFESENISDIEEKIYEFDIKVRCIKSLIEALINKHQEGYSSSTFLEKNALGEQNFVMIGGYDDILIIRKSENSKLFNTDNSKDSNTHFLIWQYLAENSQIEYSFTQVLIKINQVISEIANTNISTLSIKNIKTQYVKMLGVEDFLAVLIS